MNTIHSFSSSNNVLLSGNPKRSMCLCIIGRLQAKSHIGIHIANQSFENEEKVKRLGTILRRQIKIARMDKLGADYTRRIPATIRSRVFRFSDFFYLNINITSFFSNDSTAAWGPRPPHFFRGFTITHFRHTTLGRTPLDEGPARRRDLYLTTHNTHKRQTSMP
jgi:hypothetical protein